MRKKFFITTPIYYVNDVPHIGHTCTTVAADIIARYHKLLGDEVFFLTGTDEHGSKVAEAAEKEGLSPRIFCDKVSKNFQDVWPRLNIRYDYFIRTTNQGHEKIVQDFIQKIHQKGDIYKARYEGLYCIGCEKFVTESDLINGKCPLHPNKDIQKQSEENYFFRLSKYVPQLIKAIEDKNDKNHYLISPAAKREEVLSKLRAGVNDLSISRANVSWGIPIPWDIKQTIYVWFDALLNYYSSLEINKKQNLWPPDLHLIGKEILWFHAVIWPAMLISAGIRLPKEVLAHSFYMIDGQKMSKSLGNVISPADLLKKFDVGGTRYLIASSFPYDKDSDIGWDKFTKRYNADLANGLGNLFARVTTLAEKYSGGKVPIITHNPEKHPLMPAEIKTWRALDKAFSEYKINEALEGIWKFITEADKYIDQNRPWELARRDKKLLNWVLYGLLDAIHQIAWQIYPFMPDTAREIGKRLGIKEILVKDPLYKGSWTNIKPKTGVKSGSPLFPRLK